MKIRVGIGAGGGTLALEFNRRLKFMDNKDRRSKVEGDILDEVLKNNGTATNRNGDLKGLQQYQTPRELASSVVGRLNIHPSQTVYDPQCAYGNLLFAAPWSAFKFGVELDPVAADACGVASSQATIVEGSTPKFAQVMDELIDPEWKADYAVANPPFGLRWGGVDSTEWTLRHCMAHANKGLLIGNAATIERLGLHEIEEVWHYTTQESAWDGVQVTVGILYWENLDPQIATRPNDLESKFKLAGAIVQEERSNRKWNFWLDARGRLATFLSTRLKLTRKIDSATARNLLALEGQTPMSLAGDFKARRVMEEMIEAGYYQIEPEAEAQIKRAIEEAATAEVPIMKPTDFELVAYAEADGSLTCAIGEIRIERTDLDARLRERIEKLEALAKDPSAEAGEVEAAEHAIRKLKTVKAEGLFTAGKKYKVDSETYKFKEKFKREKVHLEESTLRTYTMSHDCELQGKERKVIIRDNDGNFHEFMDRPDPNAGNTRRVDGKYCKVYQHPEADLWKIFERPVVQTVADRFPDAIAYNLSVMDSLELSSDFQFKPGQREYLARFAVKDFGLPAAETGVGKTLLAIAASAIKGPKRTLIIAPQGTVRPSVDPDTGEMNQGQWALEIQRFAPWADVYPFFSKEDLNSHRDEDGELPSGFYLSYYECVFKNECQEFAPASWSSKKIYPFIGRKYQPRMQERTILGKTEIYDANDHKEWVEGMGECGRLHQKEPYNSKALGIKCLAVPSLAEQYGREFDMVIADEAHKACNLNAQLTDALIRLQPKYRFAFTATPIPNKASNLFSLLGWLCVPGWYKGGECNAAFPYRREDMGRFCDNFLSNERDITAEDMARNAGKSKPAMKASPILSSPARLLKLIKPTLAYISKPDCDPDYIRPEIIDVRVPMGKQQGKLYAHFMNRGNIIHKNPMTRAGIQLGVLRSICAEPVSSKYNGKGAEKHSCYPCEFEVTSPYNPKLSTILGLCRDIFDEGKQVVIVNARIGITDCIATLLEQCGIPYSRIDSTMPPRKAATQASNFKQGKSRVMLMGIKCAQAYSFDQCDRLIIGSLEYSYGSFEQAKGRIDRITSRTSKIYCVLVQASIEETLFDSVATKQDAAAICLLGQRVPRNFKPVDFGEILAQSINSTRRQDLDNLMDEREQLSHWPLLKAEIINAYRGINTTQAIA